MEIDLVSLVTLVVVVVIGSAILTRLSRLDARSRLTQQRVERIVTHLGVDADDEPHVKAARDLIAQDKKIQAIKLWRDATGAGLADAKLAVDRLASGTD
jgi:hypothetical protein